MEKKLMELCENLVKTAEALLVFTKDLTVYLKGKDNPPPMIQPELDFENDSKPNEQKKKRKATRASYSPQYLMAITGRCNDWVLKRLREWRIQFEGTHRSRRYRLTQDDIKRLKAEAKKGVEE